MHAKVAIKHLQVDPAILNFSSVTLSKKAWSPWSPCRHHKVPGGHHLIGPGHPLRALGIESEPTSFPWIDGHGEVKSKLSINILKGPRPPDASRYTSKKILFQTPCSFIFSFFSLSPKVFGHGTTSSIGKLRRQQCKPAASESNTQATTTTTTPPERCHHFMLNSGHTSSTRRCKASASEAQHVASSIQPTARSVKAPVAPTPLEALQCVEDTTAANRSLKAQATFLWRRGGGVHGPHGQ
ncbi:hypothetical protein BKA70DRAFT_1404543 [Coprinopsis sp. MPI-PUGE-AT-0042]|nr:hypothetical protein BKA70DRAFT_1404543 [Coprinopsis sp. MPI-PUGE-AT-0042]